MALSAFKSLYLGARRGRFPKLSDRESLWSLLVAITAHKSTDLIRHQNRQKRGGEGIQKRDVDGPPRDHEEVQLDKFIRDQPTPEIAAQISEQFDVLMSRLKSARDPDLVKIALAKMQGDSTADIAGQLGCVRRTVERKLLLIRRIWDDERD